jgi:serine protease Do
MRTLLFSPFLAAGAAAIAMVGASYGQPFSPEPFEPQTSVVRIGSGAMGTSFLGVNLREIDSDRAKELKLREEAGVEITRVEDDSPAAKAGLKVGDVVLAYNGQRIEGMEQFSRFVRETPPAREVKLLVSRDGNTQTIGAKLGSRKMYAVTAMPGISVAPMPRMEMPSISVMPDLPRTVMMWRTASLGIEAEALHGQMADFFGVKEGVLIRSVMKDTPAAKAGLKAGDVIVKVGDSKVSTPNEVTSALRSLREKKTAVPIVVMRDRKETTLTATIEEDRSDWDMPAPRRIAAGR